ncbi:MAG: hypothetical protein J5911_01440 [Clostridia bacterium]|nr:hypothetical protein [Clostridia bacterium]
MREYENNLTSALEQIEQIATRLSALFVMSNDVSQSKYISMKEFEKKNYCALCDVIDKEIFCLRSLAGKTLKAYRNGQTTVKANFCEIYCNSDYADADEDFTTDNDNE